MFRAFFISSIRVFLFSKPVETLPIELANLPATTSSEVSTNIFFLQSCLAHYTNIQSLTSPATTAKTAIGWYHLLKASFLLQFKSSRGLKQFKLSTIDLLVKAFTKSLFGLLLDEAVILFIGYYFNYRYQLNGKFPRFGKCYICLEKKTVSSVCENGHLICLECTMRWYKPYGAYRNCPFCRQSMNLDLRKNREFAVDLEGLLNHRLRVFFGSFVICFAGYYLQMHILLYRYRNRGKI